MSTKDIISQLQDIKLKQRIQQTGITHLRIFGSGATGQLTKDSDIDLLYESDTNTITDDRGIRGLYDELQDQLGYPVELIKKDKLAPSLQKNIFNSMISIF